MKASGSLTVGQSDIAGAIRAALTNARLGFEDSVEGVTSSDPTIVIRPVLPASLRLQVSINVSPDMFQLIANDADLRLEVQDASGDEAKWVRLCVDTFETLLANDLRIRRRRKLFGGATGAIWVPVGTGGWKGELLAYLGVGREHTFPWNRSSAT
jgi:hypothetical protein